MSNIDFFGKKGVKKNQYSMHVKMVTDVRSHFNGLLNERM